MEINPEIHNAYEVIKEVGIILYPKNTVYEIDSDT